MVGLCPSAWFVDHHIQPLRCRRSPSSSVVRNVLADNRSINQGLIRLDTDDNRSRDSVPARAGRLESVIATVTVRSDAVTLPAALK